MQCSQIQELFSGYADNELDSISVDQFKTHLASCDSCGHEWNAFERTVHFLRDMPREAAPADLLSGIHEKLNKANLLQTWWNWLQNLDLSMSIPAATATVAVALVTAVLLKSYYLEPKNQDHNLHQQTIAAQDAGQIKNPAYKRILPSNRFAVNSPRMIPAHSSRTNEISNSLPANLFPNPALREPSKGRIIPDMTLTVQAGDAENLTALHHTLMSAKNWQVQRYGNDQILILLKPGALSKLHQALAHNKLRVLGHDATFSSRDHLKNELTIAVRFQ